MYTAEDTELHLHPKLIALLEHEKRLCGCAAKAMKRVAGKVGVNEFWVRRVIGRYGKVKIQAHQFFNVLREHVRMKRAARKAAKGARRTNSLTENLSAP